MRTSIGAAGFSPGIAPLTVPTIDIGATNAAEHPWTKQDFVYHTLRDEIMRCELQPEQRLVIDSIARRLRVSAIPVRGALQLLQSERLVQLVPHVGATVAPVTRESVLDVFTLQEALGLVATRLVTERGSDDELSTLERRLAEMDAAAETREHERWMDLNARFHLCISSLTALPMLHEMAERVFSRCHCIRRFLSQGLPMPRMGEAQEDNRELVVAMRQRDTDTVAAVVSRQCRRALASHLACLEGPDG